VGAVVNRSSVQTLPAERPGTRRASVVEKHSTAVAIALTALAVGALIGWALASSGVDPGKWDLLFVSGIMTALGGLWLARGQRESFENMLERLVNRGSLAHDRGPEKAPEPPLTREELSTLRVDLGARTRRWQSWFGFSLGVTMAVVWIVNKDLNVPERASVSFNSVTGPLVGAVVGYLVGRVLGRMASYGLLGTFLSHRGVTFRATPGHVDGAAGLKPVGDYYLYQALLLTLPAIFLLAWLAMFNIPKWHDRYADRWQGTYIALLALAILLEIVVFFVPMWRAHVAMKQEKHRQLVTADTTLGPEISEVRAQLDGTLTVDARSAAQDRLESLTARYQAIESMPTWPMDHSLRRRVTLGNAALIVGLFAQLVALANWR
jgi:hypothetical protein